MTPPPQPKSKTLVADLISGMVVFLVALPLCLGIAQASKAPSPSGSEPEVAETQPSDVAGQAQAKKEAASGGVPDDKNVTLFSGILAGIIGGLLVGVLSGSHTSVAGPAAGLTAVVSAQVAMLGSFDAFLLAVMLAGLIQIGLGIARAGFISSFFPTAVIQGLLAAIGVILILKQLPHVVGHDKDPEGEMQLVQPDGETTFTELATMFGDYEPGAAVVGILSILLLVGWDRVPRLKKSLLPAPLVVVIFGVVMSQLLKTIGEPWLIHEHKEHFVEVPVSASISDFFGLLKGPDFGRIGDSAVWIAAFTIAAVASLETLLNVEAVDKLDPKRRVSPTSRELVAQGVGNTVSGLVGGLPVTSVIVRSSVNINAGGKTKLAAIFHGVLLLGCVALLPHYLNLIPISCLAAILLVTGYKLASPKLVKKMWHGGRSQFLPFVITVLAIVLTDLLKGVVIGLGVSLFFILRSNFRRPLRRSVEKHIGGEVTHVELSNQVSFLNRAAIEEAFHAVPPGGHLLLDASRTDYIDPDILGLIRDFKDTDGPARGVEVSLVGFREKYNLGDQTQYIDVSTRELQDSLTPADVLELLREGNLRFQNGRRIYRDYAKQVEATAEGQHPLAVIVACIDSRAPSEIIFDAGVGDLFVARVAGNVPSRKILGSCEYACAVAGAKLVLVLGHTRCGAVTAAVDLSASGADAAEATGCQHIDFVVKDIQESIDPLAARASLGDPAGRLRFADEAARRNVARTVQKVLGESRTLAALVAQGKVAVVGAMYDVATGAIEFIDGASA